MKTTTKKCASCGGKMKAGGTAATKKAPKMLKGGKVKKYQSAGQVMNAKADARSTAALEGYCTATDPNCKKNKRTGLFERIGNALQRKKMSNFSKPKYNLKLRG